MTPREAQLTAELTRTQGEMECLRRENQLLHAKIDLLVRRVFGSSSERIDPAQMNLLLGGQEPQSMAPAPQSCLPLPSASVAAQSRPPRPSRALRLPDNLPVVQEIIDPEPVKANPENWRQIGEEKSEQLDYEPPRYLRRITVRRTYVHRTDPDLAPLTAPLPPRLQDRCTATPSLLAHIIVSKYCDHLPLYRQEQILQTRHNIHLPRQTLVNWIDLTAWWLQRIYQHIRTGVLCGGYVQIDETPVNYLEPGAGRAPQGYFWVCKKPGGDVFFHWEPSRAADTLDKIIPVNYKGILQCDGYNAYPAFATRRNVDLQLAACWAHVRRKFYDAQKENPRVIGWLLHQIAHLYQTEAHLRQTHAGPHLRQALRTSMSRPILHRIAKALDHIKTKRHPLPQSQLGKAIDYTQNQWPGLNVYLEDGRIEIDNNAVENAIRPTAIGKKNWLFIGDKDAGQRSATLYTIIENCRHHHINPFDYLRDILTRLPSMKDTDIPSVTPAAWAKTHSQSIKPTS